ncbi:MAG: dihydropteroate synthase [Candidatus Thermoplasmatota archaeon]
MGILNATPDSFSDGGRLAAADSPDLLLQIRRMLDDGADILDIGGESTRPGHVAVPAEEELRRVLPVIRRIREEFGESVISIDTRKAAVAKAALAAGADVVNDVSGFGDPGMAAVVRDAGCSVILMRNLPCRGDVVAAASDQLAELLAEATEMYGLDAEQVILDPGLGFGDPPGGDVEANFALLRNVSSYGHGRPVLIGASRKRFIGAWTGESNPARRSAGSVAAARLAVESGAAIVRVHDVAETVAALKWMK